MENNSSYWTVSITIARELNSIESAVLYAEMESRYSLHGHVRYIGNKPYVEFTTEQIKKKTGLNYKVQKKCIRLLKDAGLIDVKLIGVPARNHFSLINRM